MEERMDAATGRGTEKRLEALDTVNRTLLTLRDIGAAFVVEGCGDAKRFEAKDEKPSTFQMP